MTTYIFGDDDKDYLAWRAGSGETVEITDIVVRSARRTGIGSALLTKLMRQLPAGTNLVWAITRANNLVAQQFYEANRFRVVGVLRNFYKDCRPGPDGNEQGEDTVDAIMYGRNIGTKA